MKTEKTKKYELVKDPFSNLFRIRALKAIPMWEVEVGQHGGLVESEKNLQQFGNCWIRFNAKATMDAKISDNALLCEKCHVFGRSWVRGNAVVKGTSEVSGYAVISDDSIISGNSKIYGNAMIYDNTVVMGNAQIHGRVRTYDDAVIDGDVNIAGNSVVRGSANIRHNKEINNELIFSLNLGDFNVTLEGDYINIGCLTMTIEEWIEKAESIGEQHKMGETTIKLYISAINWLKTVRDEKLTKLAKLAKLGTTK